MDVPAVVIVIEDGRLVMAGSEADATDAGSGGRLVLPASFSLEGVPYAREGSGSGTSRRHRIAFRDEEGDWVLGSATFAGPTGFRSSIHAELTNLEPGRHYGRADGRFFVEPDTTLLPPLPFPFEGEPWKGRRFYFPLELATRSIPEAQALVERHGGIRVRDPTRAEIVVIPETLTHLGDQRHPGAEAAFRAGALVLLEPEFWLGPPPLDPGDPDDPDEDAGHGDDCFDH